MFLNHVDYNLTLADYALKQYRSFYSRDQAGLVGPVLHHLLVGVVSHGEQVRGHLGPPLATVLGHHVGGVDGQAAIGVDHHAEQARVSLQEVTEGLWRIS